MAFVFHPRLAIPLWALAVFTTAVTAPPAVTPLLLPPTTALAVAAIGIAAIVFLMPGAIPWSLTSRSVVRAVPSGYRDPAHARSVMAGASVRQFDDPNATEADDALALVRMDDDGGWQMTRPPG